MKLLMISFTCLLLFACNSSVEKKMENNNSTNTEASENASQKQTVDKNSLKQNGDYTTLFSRDEKNCDVMSTNEMASILNLEASNVIGSNEGYGYCRFDLQLKDGSKTRISIHPLAWERKEVQREINSYKETEADFGKDNNQGILVVSNTEDTYFAIRRSRGELFMFNPNYDSAILIQFGSTIEAVNKKITYTEDQKKERMDTAIAVANFLLEKYRK